MTDMRPKLKSSEREFWERAACAALTGISADGNTSMKDEPVLAARSADLLLEEWRKRWVK